MRKPTPIGANSGLGYWSKELDPEGVQQNGTTDGQMDPVAHWWLDA